MLCHLPIARLLSAVLFLCIIYLYKFIYTYELLYPFLIGPSLCAPRRDVPARRAKSTSWTLDRESRRSTKPVPTHLVSPTNTANSDCPLSTADTWSPKIVSYIISRKPVIYESLLYLIFADKASCWVHK